MITNFLKEKSTSNKIEQIAKRHYNKYVVHYRSKNLQPITFDEFFKNYKK